MAKVVHGTNILPTTHPELAEQWHPTKNGNLKPTDVTAGSNKKVWWRHWCDHTESWHEWKRAVCEESHYAACPFCTGRKVLPGFNDLATTHPELAAEWHPTLNGDLKPSQISYGSEKKAWWLCPKCNRAWKASPNSRTNRPMLRSCPNCPSEWGTSFPEQALYFYLNKELSCKIENRAKVNLAGRIEELDIWIPRLNTAFEWDGLFFHAKRAEKDNEKDIQAAKAGIRLIRIVETTDERKNDEKIYCNVRKKKAANIEKAIIEALKRVDRQNPDIDLKRDGVQILARYKASNSSKSLATRFPELAKEWDYARNKGLLPSEISYGSSIEVWWKCPRCGRSYRKSSGSRTNPHTRNLKHCPYCPTTRGKASRKSVRCVETGIVYGSMTMAANKVSRSVSAITLACKKGTTCAGYHWRYESNKAEDAEQARTIT